MAEGDWPKVDGDVFFASEANNLKYQNNVWKQIGENHANNVSSTNSQILAGSSLKLVDKFLDSSGQNNTVDAGAGTTALYIPNRYICSISTSIETDTAFASTNKDSTTGSYGHKIHINNTCVLKSVTKDSSSVATECRLYTNIGELIETATYIGNIAYFTLPVLSAGTDYSLENYKSGTYNARYKSSPGYPFNNTTLNITQGSSGGGTAGGTVMGYEIASLQVYTTSTLTYLDSIVLSTATTIPTGMTKVMVTPLMYEALSGSDNITADVSIDGGSNYTTGIPINTWSPITSANGTSLIVKANLHSATGVSSPKLSGWSIFLE